MIALLSAPLPIPARGVAMANVLLTDGAGPLYNPRCDTELRRVVEATNAQLDPSRAVIAST